MKKAIEMELILKDSTTVLADGFSAGGFVKQVVVFDVPEEKYDSPLFVHELYQRGQTFLQENVEVKFTEVKE